mmetsp:Transcript_12310/g.19617  ORF Transcript_12310/g.19617 Transcript_12310/m.19617 type:complete len:86 (-) Transcript_12310:919-1176(-)
MTEPRKLIGKEMLNKTRPAKKEMTPLLHSGSTEQYTARKRQPHTSIEMHSIGPWNFDSFRDAFKNATSRTIPKIATTRFTRAHAT